ncbi:MAG TPA: isocitrate/isopropylmalate family dehydrogenase, partial [Armatimonadota bacterium]
MSYTVTLIPGDGTGPELAEATRRVIDATGVKIDWEIAHAGVDIMAEFGTPLPDATLESVRRNGVALKAPITTPIGSGFRSVNVALRKELDLYACVRPCKSYPGVRSRYENVDIVIVRENTEDLYAGVEYDLNSPEAQQIIGMAGGKIRSDSAISIKPISVTGTRRIV